MMTVFGDGQTFVSTNLTFLSNALLNAAANGQRTFTVNIITAQSPTALKLNGNYLQAYLAGISSGLELQEILPYECTPTLNTSDSLTVSIDFNFTF